MPNIIILYIKISCEKDIFDKKIVADEKVRSPPVVPEAPLEGGRAQEALRGEGGAQCIGGGHRGGRGRR